MIWVVALAFLAGCDPQNVTTTSAAPVASTNPGPKEPPKPAPSPAQVPTVPLGGSAGGSGGAR